LPAMACMSPSDGSEPTTSKFSSVRSWQLGRDEPSRRSEGRRCDSGTLRQTLTKPVVRTAVAGAQDRAPPVAAVSRAEIGNKLKQSARAKIIPDKG
jgi:hypothetical protein